MTFPDFERELFPGQGMTRYARSAFTVITGEFYNAARLAARDDLSLRDSVWVPGFERLEAHLIAHDLAAPRGHLPLLAAAAGHARGVVRPAHDGPDRYEIVDRGGTLLEGATEHLNVRAKLTCEGCGVVQCRRAHQ